MKHLMSSSSQDKLNVYSTTLSVLDVSFRAAMTVAHYFEKLDVIFVLFHNWSNCHAPKKIFLLICSHSVDVEKGERKDPPDSLQVKGQKL